MTLLPEPVSPPVVPVTHAGVTPRAVPTRKGCEPLTLLAVNTYVVPACKVLGSVGV